MSFDYLADTSVKPNDKDWQQQAAVAKRGAATLPLLTQARTEFLKRHALEGANEHAQGRARMLTCDRVPETLDTARRTAAAALAGFPRYSARLLLEFRLLTPLLTRDDDAFYLFDNPARKDHIFRAPFLAAASVKGLAADAYQRAFPGMTPWGKLVDADATNAERTRAFRIADPHGLRLFGIADDGTERGPGSQAGRLHFSAVWFRQLQFLVMNPRDKRKAIGTVPIQFEAVAPGERGIIEVVYFNPRGAKDSDEPTVRADLARWLAAVATWWPVLGLGAKRLGAYGSISVEQARLQVVGWSGMEDAKGAASGSTAAPTAAEPSYYRDYLDSLGTPINEEVLSARIQEAMQAIKQEMAQLDHARRHSQGRAQGKAVKAWEKAKEKRKNKEQEMRTQWARVLQYWQAHGARIPQRAVKAAPREEWPVQEKKLSGPGSWMDLARWIAEESQDGA